MFIKRLPPLVKLALIVSSVIMFFLCLCSAMAYLFPYEDIREEINHELQKKQSTSQVQTAKVTRVVDGDTLKLMINGQEQTARLVGIDTPESVDPRKPVQCYAIEASAKLKDLILDKEVIYEFDTKQGHTDKYDRLLLYIWLPQKNSETEETLFVNEYMVKEGYAHAYTKIDSKYLEEFKSMEKQAAQQNKGLWGSVCE